MPQGRVAEPVAELIVDRLEMIQVAHEGGDGATPCGRRGQDLRSSLIKPATVEQPGQRIQVSKSIEFAARVTKLAHHLGAAHGGRGEHKRLDGRHGKAENQNGGPADRAVKLAVKPERRDGDRGENETYPQQSLERGPARRLVPCENG